MNPAEKKSVHKNIVFAIIADRTLTGRLQMPMCLVAYVNQTLLGQGITINILSALHDLCFDLVDE